MDIAIKLILWVHLMSLALAGSAAFGGPAVLALMRAADASQRAALAPVLAKLAALGRMALVLLILTGVALIVTKLGGVSGLNPWFHTKMFLVVLMIALSVFGLINAKKARSGDAAAAARMPMLSKVGMALLVGIVLCAVFAFN
jgi:putative membrane protein